MTELLVAARRVVDAETDQPGWLLLRDARVFRRGYGEPERTPDLSFDVVVPPFVDVHTHGAHGVDFADLGADPDPAILYHRSLGSTTIEASIATGPLSAMKTRIRELAGYVADGQLAGIHLEGPWLSPSRCGAHDPALLREPEPGEVISLIEAGDGAVRMVTIAPELPGAMASIKAMAEAGVVAALGHTAADAETVKRALAAGARSVTHLFNGMPPLHHREIGLPGIALLDDRLGVELIVDGRHVCDDAVDLVAATAAKRMLLVSDSMAATGLGDGDFVVAGSKVKVIDGVARLASGDSLAGSTSVIRDAVERLIGNGADFVDIVRWTNTNPAMVLGLEVPKLRVGDRADLLGFSGRKLTHVVHAGVPYSEPPPVEASR